MVKKSKGKSGRVQKGDTFLNKVSESIKKHPVIWAVSILILVAALFFLVRSINAKNNANMEFQTIAVERGDLIAIVGATGIVEANQSVDLIWETTGRVSSVSFSVNDKVEPGDVLAVLADNTLPQSVILAEADLVAAKRGLEDLVSSNTESAVAYTALLEAEKDLRNAEDERDEWNYNESDMDRIYSARSEFLSAEEDYKAARVAYAKVRNLEDDESEKIEAKELLAEIKLRRDKALRNLNYIMGKSFDQQVAEDFADFDVAIAQLEDAQREWDRVKDGPNADDISAAEAKVAAAEATVSLGWIEAPFGGTVTKVFPKVGDEVSVGTSAFRVDDLSALYVDVEISEVDINRVEVGQKTDLSFDAVIGETYKGEVVEVATVGNDSGSGVDFLVTLQIIDPSDDVRPGMTAAVNIIVSEINDVITIPNRAVRLKDNRRVVYLLEDGESKEVEIEFGASSDINSEVISGDIAEGDLIILNPPMEFMTNGGPPPFMRQ